jgi:hypothetical protein
VRRAGLLAVLACAVAVLVGFWPRSGGAQWATVVRAAMAAEVNGPSTIVDVQLQDGRVGRFKIGFAEGSAEAGDVLCVSLAENLAGRLTLQLAFDADCSKRPPP